MNWLQKFVGRSNNRREESIDYLALERAKERANAKRRLQLLQTELEVLQRSAGV